MTSYIHQPRCQVIQLVITRHMTVVMQLANPRHPRPVHISRYCPFSRSNITRYGLDFDPEYYQNMEKSVVSLAVRVINVLLTAHAGNTVLDTCLNGAAVRACIGRYCPGAWSITHTYIYAFKIAKCQVWCQQNLRSLHDMDTYIVVGG